MNEKYTVEKAYNEFVDYFNDSKTPVQISEVIKLRNELRYQKSLLRRTAFHLIDSIQINYPDCDLDKHVLTKLKDFRKEFKAYFDEESPIVSMDKINVFIEKAKRIYKARFPNINEASLEENLNLEMEIAAFSNSIHVFEIKLSAINLMIRTLFRPLERATQIHYFHNSEHKSKINEVVPGRTSDYQTLYHHLEFILKWNPKMRTEYLKKYKDEKGVVNEILKYLKREFPKREKFPDTKTLKEKLGLIKSSGRRVIGG